MSAQLIYGISLFLPFSFLLISITKIIKHWKDGITPAKKRPLLYYVKLNVTGILILFISIEGIVLFWIDGDFIKIKQIFYLSLAISWLLSIVVLRFQFRRHIQASWFGIRGFWILTSLLLIGTSLYEIALLNQDLDYWSQIIEEIVSWVIIILSLFFLYAGIMKPDDFYIMEDVYRMIGDWSPGQIRLKDQNHFDLKLEIREIKTQIYKGKQKIWYNISVKIANQQWIVKKTYNQFFKFHQKLVQALGQDIIPKFPSFHNSQVGIDTKIWQLNEYLQNIQQSDKIINETLAFLEFKQRIIPGVRFYQTEYSRTDDSEREMIKRQTTIDLYEETMGAEDPIGQSNWKYPVIFDIWVQFLSKTAFKINWECSLMDQYGEVSKTISNLNDLHTKLKKQIYPGQLPKFPSRGLIRNQIQKQSIKKRKTLEGYLKILLNDPAYHSEALFNFLHIPFQLEALWSKIPTIQLQLAEDLSWEGDIDYNGNFYVKYNIVIIPSVNSQQLKQFVCQKRYSQLYKLHQDINSRIFSPFWLRFVNYKYQRRLDSTIITKLPIFPPKTYNPLINIMDIDQRKNGLQLYMQNLFYVPYVAQCQILKEFLSRN